jgi:hypothetical protein
VAFDEEVSAESIEIFRKTLHRVRHPPNIFHHFAFSGHIAVPQTPMQKIKEKNATLKYVDFIYIIYFMNYLYYLFVVQEPLFEL